MERGARDIGLSDRLAPAVLTAPVGRHIAYFGRLHVRAGDLGFGDRVVDGHGFVLQDNPARLFQQAGIPS